MKLYPTELGVRLSRYRSRRVLLSSSLNYTGSRLLGTRTGSYLTYGTQTSGASTTVVETGWVTQTRYTTETRGCPFTGRTRVGLPFPTSDVSMGLITDTSATHTSQQRSTS